MAIEHKFWCEIQLESANDISAQNVTVRLNDEIYYQGDVSSSTVVYIEKLLPPGQHDLTIYFQGKSELDLHQALKITGVQLNGILDQQFVWQAEYTPCYPEPWRSQQIQSGIELPQTMKNTDYLGWNGVWNLRFESPVFTWIHRIKDFGWIYD
jgi:hypothetical protein